MSPSCDFVVYVQRVRSIVTRLQTLTDFLTLWEDVGDLK